MKYKTDNSPVIIKSCDYWEILDTTASFTKIAGQRLRFRKIYLKYALEHTKKSKKLPLTLNITVYFPKSPFFACRYNLINSTDTTVNDLSLYWLVDLDVEGKESYKDNHARYHEGVIYQYHGVSNVCAGFCSTITPSKYECNSPYAIRIKPHHLDLTNINSRGPADCAIGMQWDFEQLLPQESIDLPIVFAAGINETTFYANMEMGLAFLKEIENADDPRL